MIKEDFLQDDLSIRGNHIGDFRRALAIVDKHTKAVKINTNDFTVLSYTEVPKGEDGYLYFFALPAGKPWKGAEGDKLPLGRIKKENILKRGGLELIKEMSNGVKTLIMLHGEIYFLSNLSIDSLGRRANFSGRRLLENDLARNINLAQGFKTHVSQFNGTMVYRKCKQIKKAFAVFSEKYTYVPQSILSTIIDNLDAEQTLGDMECKEWEVNHSMSKIFIEFPDKGHSLQQTYGLPDKFIPGLYLATSDTGHSSLTALPTWKVGGSVSYGVQMNEGGKRRHSGDVDPEEFAKSIGDNIFKQYTKLPERLGELLAIDITNPNWNLNDSKDRRANKEAVSAAIKDTFKQLKMVKKVGKKLEVELYESLCGEIDPSLLYTAYDIATAVMELASRVDGIADSTRRNLQQTISNAPFCTFKKPNTNSKITLTA